MTGMAGIDVSAHFCHALSSGVFWGYRYITSLGIPVFLANDGVHSHRFAIFILPVPLFPHRKGGIHLGILQSVFSQHNYTQEVPVSKPIDRSLLSIYDRVMSYLYGWDR